MGRLIEVPATDIPYGLLLLCLIVGAIFAIPTSCLDHLTHHEPAQTVAITVTKKQPMMMQDGVTGQSFSYLYVEGKDGNNHVRAFATHDKAVYDSMAAGHRYTVHITNVPMFPAPITSATPY